MEEFGSFEVKTEVSNDCKQEEPIGTQNSYKSIIENFQEKKNFFGTPKTIKKRVLLKQRMLLRKSTQKKSKAIKK